MHSQDEVERYWCNPRMAIPHLGARRSINVSDFDPRGLYAFLPRPGKRNPRNMLHKATKRFANDLLSETDQLQLTSVTSKSTIVIQSPSHSHF